MTETTGGGSKSAAIGIDGIVGVASKAGLATGGLHEIFGNEGLFQQLTSSTSTAHIEQLTDWELLSATESWVETDTADSVLQATCSVCEGMLISSIVAGEQVVREGDDWFHAACLQSLGACMAGAETRGTVLWQPNALN